MSADFEALLNSLVPGAGRGEPASADAPDFPRQLGLEPLELLARGGTGWVFRARDPVLDREVAVKIARPDQGRAAQDSVLAEARRTAALAHSSVLPVHRMVVAGGLICAEYQLAPRVTVEAMLADPQLLAERNIPGRLLLLRGPVRALRRAHQRDVIHGDVHPGNLLLGEDDEVYLLDWTGVPPTVGDTPTFSGSPGHAAPEVLAGAPHTAAADVYALGVIAWELCAGRPMRPRQRGEDLGGYVARWRDRTAPELPAEIAVPAGVPALLRAALDPDPQARASVEVFARLLDEALSGEAERTSRKARGDTLLGQARELLGRYRELGQRLDDERQVVAIQRARVPGHAPEAAKKAMWEAEDRLEELELRRGLMWLDAVEQSVLAGALGGGEHESRDMVAELWWVRMEDMAARNLDREVSLAAHQVSRFDPERRGAVLRAPCRVSIEVRTAMGEAPSSVRAVLHRLVPEHRRLVPHAVADLPIPLQAHALPPGRWLLTLDAPGLAPVRYPLVLSRGEHHEARICMHTPAQVGEGWVQVPSGPFLLGGDPLARQPMPRCRPTIGDLFVRRTCVTSAEWLEYLRALPAEEAQRRCPGATSPTGAATPWWFAAEEGWSLPAGWDPRWPVVGVDTEDAAAYAGWVSALTGRNQRLPTEEEWEKAARGVDGRTWPWGDRFDPTFAHMRGSRTGMPGLGPVGAFPVDTSPYGCQDMAGLVREWTASWMDHDLAVVRGGSWSDEADDLRVAARSGQPPRQRSALVGFRLVSEQPAAT